jgi:DNA polymerase I-like protein with 3'-5' exonuclease and polymerase domains
MTQSYLKEKGKYSKEIHLLYRAKDYSQKLHTYGVEKLQEHMDSSGRVHATWYVAEETTGRLTCRAPAFQAMPSLCRQFFQPAQGYCYVTIDYSTIEMRVLAYLSKDANLISELQEGCDVHSHTASAIFKKPAEDVTKEERQIGKSVGFMITYGGTAQGLSKKLTERGVNCSVQDAQLMIGSYKMRHPSVAYYHYALLNGIIKPTTIMGHEFEGLTGSKALNYPVQASAAEGFKLTLEEVVNRKPPEYKLVMAIHDSITLEVPVAEKEAAEIFLKTTAEAVMGNFLDPVPVFVEVKNNI